jgi:thiamine transport system permease protein
MRHPAWPAALPLAFLLLFFLVPVTATLAHALAPGTLAWVLGPYVTGTLRLAATQAALSTLLAFAVGAPLAWLHHRRRIPFGRVQLALHAVPFTMPVFVVVFGLQATLGREGLGLLPAIGPMGAVVVAHAYYNYGLVARLLHAALEARPRRLEEAARSLGASPAAAFARASLPLLAPAAGGAALLVFLFSLGAFGTVLLMGDGRVRTLETVAYDYLGPFGDPARAAAMGALQLALNGLLLAGYLALRRRHLRLVPGPQPSRPGRLAALATWLAAGLALAPIGAVLVGGFRLRGSWSLEPWRSLLAGPEGFELGPVLARTLGYAAAATMLALAMTLALAYAARGRPRWGRVAEGLAGLPLAQSSLLAGVGLTIAYGAGSLDLRDTPWLLVAAHTVVAFPFVARVLLPALDALDERLDEAAALLGAPSRNVLARVHAPLLRRVLLVCAATAAALSLGDFGATTVLATSETRPLVGWIGVLDGPFDPLLRARAEALAGLLAVLALAATLGVEAVAGGAKGLRPPDGERGASGGVDGRDRRRRAA